MVFFILTRTGYEELFQQFGMNLPMLWVTENVFSDAEVHELCEKGLHITKFNYTISSEEPSEIINGAVDTIKEHHPNESIWVENISILPCSQAFWQPNTHHEP